MLWSRFSDLRFGNRVQKLLSLAQQLRLGYQSAVDSSQVLSSPRSVRSLLSVALLGEPQSTAGDRRRDQASFLRKLECGCEVTLCLCPCTSASSRSLILFFAQPDADAEPDSTTNHRSFSAKARKDLIFCVLMRGLRDHGHSTGTSAGRMCSLETLSQQRPWPPLVMPSSTMLIYISSTA